MEDYRLEQTGQEVQEILNGAATKSELEAESLRIDAINGKIPSEASDENQLTDKDYVDGLVSDEQSARRDADADLQNQINAIVNDKAVVNLSATPSPIFVGVEKLITLVATSDMEATSIKIKKGDTELASGSGFNLTGYDTLTPSEAGNTTYQAVFTIAGLNKPATKNVVAVYPIYFGAGQAYTDAQYQASATTSPAGTYNVPVMNDGDYVFFVVPSTMTINKATMSGFDFPLQAPTSVEIEGVFYKSYQSSNTYITGTLNIIIS